MSSQDYEEGQVAAGLAIANMMDAVTTMEAHLKAVMGTRYLTDTMIVEMLQGVEAMHRGVQACAQRVNSVMAEAKLMVVLDDMGDELR